MSAWKGSTETENIAKLQCMLAAERIRYVETKTLLSDTQTELFSEKEKNGNLVKVVDHLEALIQEQKNYFEDRVENLKKRHEIEIEKQKLTKELTDNLDAIKEVHEVTLKQVRKDQETRNQVRMRVALHVKRTQNQQRIQRQGKVCPSICAKGQELLSGV